MKGELSENDLRYKAEASIVERSADGTHYALCGVATLGAERLVGFLGSSTERAA